MLYVGRRREGNQEDLVGDGGKDAKKRREGNSEVKKVDNVLTSQTKISNRAKWNRDWELGGEEDGRLIESI